MPPLKGPEFTKLARERLEPTLKSWGFKRTPKATPASWCRPEGDAWLVFWFQPRSSNDAFSAGYRFTMEFLLGTEPRLYGSGYRDRFPALLTDAGRDRLRELENRAIAKLPPPNQAYLAQPPEPTRTHVLEGWRPRTSRYGSMEDVWMRQGDEADVEALLAFILEELPGVIDRFLARAPERHAD